MGTIITLNMSTVHAIREDAVTAPNMCTIHAIHEDAVTAQNMCTVHAIREDAVVDTMITSSLIRQSVVTDISP